MTIFDWLARNRVPTIDFDQSTVTPSVRRGLWVDIIDTTDIDRRYAKAVYRAALSSILRGRDLGSLNAAIIGMNLPGLEKWRAADITRRLHNRATVRINRGRQLAAGQDRAIWIHSGAPCGLNRTGSENYDTSLDAAHRAANGKTFSISMGLKVDAQSTWPGFEDGCKCFSRPVLTF